MSNRRNVAIASFIAAVISAVAGIWVLEIDRQFLPFPVLAGMALVFVQKERTSRRFIGKLFFGSLFYGFLTWLLVYARMHFMFAEFPFWPIYNPNEYIIFSLVLSFVCFLGGLFGVVVKGSYYLLRAISKDKND